MNCSVKLYRIHFYVKIYLTSLDVIQVDVHLYKTMNIKKINRYESKRICLENRLICGEKLTNGDCKSIASFFDDFNDIIDHLKRNVPVKRVRKTNTGSKTGGAFNSPLLVSKIMRTLIGWDESKREGSRLDVAKGLYKYIDDNKLRGDYQPKDGSKPDRRMIRLDSNLKELVPDVLILRQVDERDDLLKFPHFQKLISFHVKAISSEPESDLITI